MGLALSPEGIIEGIPEVAGTLDLDLTVSSGGLTDTRSLALQVLWNTLSVSSATLPAISFQNQWEDTLRAEGGDGDYAWMVS